MILQPAFRCAVVCLAAAFSGGCVTVEMFKNGLAYEPERMSSRIDARVSLDVLHTISPEAQEVWRSWGNGPETIGNWELAVREVIIDDVVKSGLFASAQADGMGEFDYLIRIRSQDIRSPDRFSAELQVCDWKTKNVISTYKRERPASGRQFDDIKSGIQVVMAQLKADVLADLGKGQIVPHGVQTPQQLPDQHAPAPPAPPGPDLQPQI